jgi:hypothetical protein
MVKILQYMLGVPRYDRYLGRAHIIRSIFGHKNTFSVEKSMTNFIILDIFLSDHLGTTKAFPRCMHLEVKLA